MTKEENDLLLRDLCSRLPHGVICTDSRHGDSRITEIDTRSRIVYFDDVDEYVEIEKCKPYLFPLSSMTEEQKKEYNYWKHEVPVGYYEYGDIVEKIELFDSPESFEYLIENHFDYHGLIEKGLAIDATGKNIY